MNEKYLTPCYNADELVRLELLRYENPDGLHPVERDWRNLARKLLEHVEHAENVTKTLHDSMTGYALAKLGDNIEHWKPYKFPVKFKSSHESSSNLENV